jgi:hypothetical protein
VSARNDRRVWAVVALLMAIVAGQGIHWFFTPAVHPDAGAGQVAAVALQVLVGLGVAYYAVRKSRRQGD